MGPASHAFRASKPKAVQQALYRLKIPTLLLGWRLLHISRGHVIDEGWNDM
jgi:hypothetical protein